MTLEKAVSICRNKEATQRFADKMGSDQAGQADQVSAVLRSDQSGGGMQQRSGGVQQRPGDSAGGTITGTTCMSGKMLNNLKTLTL